MSESKGITLDYLMINMDYQRDDILDILMHYGDDSPVENDTIDIEVTPNALDVRRYRYTSSAWIYLGTFSKTTLCNSIISDSAPRKTLSEYNAFISQELNRMKILEPHIQPKERMRLAMAKWREKKNKLTFE